MKKEIKRPLIINSISEQHRLYSLPKPEHPLVSLINIGEVFTNSNRVAETFIFNFYSIAIKRGFQGKKLKYGQNYYDFDEGVMAFMAPGQMLTTEMSDEIPQTGWILFFHPDFLRGYPLGKKIKEYGFFSYATNEALHLSEKEEKMIETIMKNIEQEYRSSIDKFSQDVMISHIELLLNYSNRFYNRQFITRKNANNDLLTKLEELLDDYFNGEKVSEFGLPTVRYVSEQLNISPNYLSDMLRSLTGQSTQQHIHDKLIEKAKEILTATSFSVGEIAYKLGFETPQSFSKLFKHKTNVSPLEYRNSFH
jgi:AraC family transcriptional regulator, transcriptional activator of pobA